MVFYIKNLAASLLILQMLTGCGGEKPIDETTTTPLEEIDFSKFTDPTLRTCVASAGVTKIAELTRIGCFGRKLSSTVGIEQLTALTYLALGRNQLTAIDVSANTALTVLSLFENQLTTIDLSANTDLSGLSLDNNQLTKLELATNTDLIYLFAERSL